MSNAENTYGTWIIKYWRDGSSFAGEAAINGYRDDVRRSGNEEADRMSGGFDADYSCTIHPAETQR